MHGWLEPHGPYDPKIYWRRRAFVATVLLVGMTLLGLAVRGLLLHKAAIPPQEKSPSPMIAAASSTTENPTPATAVTSAEPVATPEASVASAPAEVKGCIVSELKVSLAGNASVKSGTDQVMTVAILNAGQQKCSLTVNEAFELKITSGSDQIWTTAHCPGWRGDAITELESGKYREWQVTWGTRRSAQGCQITGDYLRPGTYVAQANYGEAQSKKLVIDVIG